VPPKRLDYEIRRIFEGFTACHRVFQLAVRSGVYLRTCTVTLHANKYNVMIFILPEFEKKISLMPREPRCLAGISKIMKTNLIKHDFGDSTNNADRLLLLLLILFDMATNNIRI
jgi:hypothetical protein